MSDGLADRDGIADGEALGSPVGITETDGSPKGARLGSSDGCRLGSSDGWRDGVLAMTSNMYVAILRNKFGERNLPAMKEP